MTALYPSALWLYLAFGGTGAIQFLRRHLNPTFTAALDSSFPMWNLVRAVVFGGIRVGTKVRARAKYFQLTKGDFPPCEVTIV